LVDGRARLATAEEAKAFREKQAEAKRMADDLAAASRVQLTVLSNSELSKLKGHDSGTSRTSSVRSPKE
jgi:hypothetical protein